MAEPGCRHFNGYKPCERHSQCDRSCPSYASVAERILIVHLEAMGAVLRSTSLIPAIKRIYPKSHITWITKGPSHLLLQNCPGVDRVLTLQSEDLLKLGALKFDIGFVIDKSLTASGLVALTRVDRVLGFRVEDSHGAIVPANREAIELWELGLSDARKFFVNQKSENQLVHEALSLGEYKLDEYQISLSDEEEGLAAIRKQLWTSQSLGVAKTVIGINTGCSPILPYKKLSVDGHRLLIQDILTHPLLRESKIVLLGGPEDTERNAAIARGLPVVVSPTDRGLRDGLVSVAACDLVVSGDSLGMHMAIGLKKWVVAWFGPTCPQEIELYGRGRKILTRAACSPCWKRVCHKSIMCYDQVDFREVISALCEGVQWLTLSSKPPSQGTSSSPSPY